MPEKKQEIFAARILSGVMIKGVETLPPLVVAVGKTGDPDADVNTSDDVRTVIKITESVARRLIDGGQAMSVSVDELNEHKQRKRKSKG